MKAFDIHCHYNHGAEFDTVENELSVINLDFLKRERERLNVVGAGFSSFASVLSDKIVLSENEHCFNLAQKEDWFYQWAVLCPTQPASFKQVEQLLKEKKVLGIKIHSPCHNYPILDYADQIFSFAKKMGAFVLMHPDNLIESSKIAYKYGVKLINAHLGSLEHVSAMQNSKNIFTDTSGCASYKNNVVEYAVATCGSENILFGTDTYSCAFQKGRIELADISNTDKENILYKNAVRLFPQIKPLFE